MKNLKKFASLMLASAMVVSAFAGCGAKAETSSSDTFKIGGIGPTTGDYGMYGTAVKNGAQIAVDEINAAGGINGKQIEYKFEDDVTDVEKSVNAYNALKDWGAQMIVGSTTSDCCTAVGEKSKEDNLFQLTPSATAVKSVQYDNAFRMCFSDPNQGGASAQYIGENGLAEKVFVIYDSSSDYSSGIYTTFAQKAAEYNIEVAAEAFTADSNKDFSVQIQKAKDFGADIVFLPIYYSEATLIMQQADKDGYKTTFFGCDGLDGILDVPNFDVSLAEGTMLLTGFAADAQDDLTKSFVAKYEEAYGETPLQFAAGAYDCVYAIKAAAEKAGVTPDMSASDICDKLKAAMLEIQMDGLTGTGITWGADGEPNKLPKAVIIEGGAYKAM